MPFPPAAPLKADATNDTALANEHPQRHNDVATAVGEIVAELGAGPKGTEADLTARLATLDTTLSTHGHADLSPAAHTHPVTPHPDLAAHDTLGLATQAELDAAVALRQLTSEKAQPSGYASLDSGGKIPTGQLPALAITSTHVVDTEAAMLALVAEEGDVAIRTDFVPRRAFILRTNDPALAANWEALDPATVVTSVNGATGDVTDVVFATDARLSDSRTPTGPAGGVLAGTYPAPTFAADMATQAELDAHGHPGLAAATHTHDYAATAHTHPYVETATLAASGKGFVNHGAVAGTARPAGYASVEWFGTVEPVNAINGDTWNSPT